MFSSFKLTPFRMRRNSESSSTDKKASKESIALKKSKTPHGTPIFRRHCRRSSDASGCPTISSLRTQASEKLGNDDDIRSVNTIIGNRCDDPDILDNENDFSILETDFTIPDYASQNTLCITSKIANITIEKIDGSLGITLRGGAQRDQNYARPLIITNVRSKSSAHRCGLIKPGDRLLCVDSQNITKKTLLEAQEILTRPSENNMTTLTIEYDVNVMESVKYAVGPLLVEVERYDIEDLGLILNNYSYPHGNEVLSTGIYIEKIRSASVADRCGALHIGDQILAIDDMYIDFSKVTSNDVLNILKRIPGNGTTKLQILPNHVNKISSNHRSVSGIWNYPKKGVNNMSTSVYSTLNSRKSKSINKRFTKSKFENIEENFQNIYSGFNTQLGVYHSETLNITLSSECNSYGLCVCPDDLNAEQSSIIITEIIPKSVADRCGCLQVGDRILSVNQKTNLTADEISMLLEPQYKNSRNKIDLKIEFDVTDSIVPTSGIFTVKLAKQNGGLGITITASKINPEDPFIISEIKRGSAAHRIGTIHVGDRILEINNQILNHLNVEKLFNNLLYSHNNEIVTLKIEKIGNNSENLKNTLDDIIYTVEICRNGGPLGITISGSEDCIEPIVLSRLIEGGLAEKTGALHVGDRIIAINGECLINKPLSEAIRLLQTSDNRVQLKIARRIKETLPTCEETRENYPSPGVQSIDSAVESWTGSVLLDSSNSKIEQISQLEDNLSIALSEAQSLISTMSNETKRNYDENSKNDSIQYYSDTDDVLCSTSPLQLPKYIYTNSLQNKDISNNFPYINTLLSTKSREDLTKAKRSKEDKVECDSSEFTKNNFFEFDDNNSNFDRSAHDLHHVILFKDGVYDDYGFSVSDGLYEKGVYINRIRKGGPADIVGLLKPYDRILQVNGTNTQDFDCCLTVPLIASAGDRIELIVARSNISRRQEYISYSWAMEERGVSHLNSDLSDSQSTIIKSF